MISAKVALWITLAAFGYSTVLAVTALLQPTPQDRYVELAHERVETVLPEIEFSEPKSSHALRRRFPDLRKVTLRASVEPADYTRMRDSLHARFGRMGAVVQSAEQKPGHYTGQFVVPGLDTVDVDLWSSSGKPGELILTFTERNRRWR